MGRQRDNNWRRAIGDDSASHKFLKKSNFEELAFVRPALPLGKAATAQPSGPLTILAWVQWWARQGLNL
jgi:hypothetical protein